jgi:hypothetical protein
MARLLWSLVQSAHRHDACENALHPVEIGRLDQVMIEACRLRTLKVRFLAIPCLSLRACSRSDRMRAQFSYQR